MKATPIPEHLLDTFAEQDLKTYYDFLQAQLAWTVHNTDVDDLEGDEYNDCLNYIIKQALEMLLELHKENTEKIDKFNPPKCREVTFLLARTLATFWARWIFVLDMFILCVCVFPPSNSLGSHAAVNNANANRRALRSQHDSSSTQTVIKNAAMGSCCN